MDTPSPPPPPNPALVAAAQMAANVSAAIASVVLSNADEETPDGSVTYQSNGSYELEDPVINDKGEVTGSNIRVIPKFKRVVAFSAPKQQIWDKRIATDLQMQTLALQQAQGLTTVMGQRMSLTGARPHGIAPQAPNIITSTPDPSAFIQTIGISDTSAERIQIEDALFNRLNDQISIRRAARVTELEIKGIFPGSKAYARAMTELDDEATDARIRVFLVASEEQQRRLGIEREKAEFANSVLAQQMQQRVMLVELANKSNVQRFQALIELANFSEDLRKASIQELVLERTQPMNEVSSITHGTRLDIPAFRQFMGSTVQAAPIGQYIYQTAAINQQQWQAKVQQQQQMFGAVLSAAGAIGGAFIGARMPGGGSVGGSMFEGMFGKG